MKNYLIQVILLFLVHSLYGQDTDTLFTLNELSYNSAFERDAVYDFFHSDNPDYLALFIAASGSTGAGNYQQIRNNYNTFYRKINTTKFKSSNEKKKIKLLFQSVHDAYFKKYELKTEFGEIFSNGNFNCVTASALYAILLKDMGIPFVVKETPVHVYLVAYPSIQGIRIEATDPVTGYYSYDQRSKASFVEYLQKNKIISEDEAQNTSPEDIFNSHFYPDNDIYLRELLGLQYLNQGSYKLMDKNLKEGYDEFEKAYLFYPSEKIRFLMLTTLTEMLNDQYYTEPVYINYLAKLTRFKNYGIKTENIRNEFIRITNYHLINRSNLEYYDSTYRYLSEKITDIECKKEIDFVYYFERGRFLILRGKPRDAHECFANAYKVKPENSDAQAAFVQSLAAVLENTEPLQAVRTVENYYGKYRDLHTNALFRKLLLHAYLMGAYQSFSTDQAVKGDAYLVKFESICEADSSIEVLQDAVGEAYTSASVCYFKKGNTSKAKNLITRGLKYAPGNYQLIMCQYSF